MDDNELIELYFARSEKAISGTADMYDLRLRKIAYRLLSNHSDTDECLSDTYFKVWNAIPPNRPKNLFAFCATVCRRTAINMIEKQAAQKRSATVVELTNEMEECIPASDTITENEDHLTELVNEFLETLDEEKRVVFVRRYCYYESAAEIAEKYGFTQSKVRVMMHRTRKKFKNFLAGKDVGS
ncbi:RNA polymerase sigma factor [Ruminococcus albus]|uniref:RNA polymerase sigma-70 factor, ECF subfamily n=1 Tax=Ruminococcus albus TaxID=1264 RepID=A0A1H7GS82_RUMAL|nr:sigma-70 family RNA polymerase sigma factor [Ruminococcus albus]SEK41043.1 RNA polymerase sigma-70 factor, ECF subfamily [Ruminococcus albus]